MVTSMTPAALKALTEGKLENFRAAITPGGIEAQEKQGQTDLVNVGIPYLPKQLGNYQASDNEYRAHGIEIPGGYDDVFYVVKLPDRWKLRATEHAMWSVLLDEQGIERADIFCKVHCMIATLTSRSRVRVYSKAQRSIDDICHELNGPNCLTGHLKEVISGEFTGDHPTITNTLLIAF
jgi:hypothetical protein